VRKLNILFLKYRVSDQLTHTATVTSKALTVDSKTSKASSDWSNLQTSHFYSGSCDTQGMKKSYIKLSHKKTNNKTD